MVHLMKRRLVVICLAAALLALTAPAARVHAQSCVAPTPVPTCAAGEVLTSNGTALVCVAGTPAPPTCNPPKVLNWNGTAWSCNAGSSGTAGTYCAAPNYCGKAAGKAVCYMSTAMFPPVVTVTWNASGSAYWYDPTNGATACDIGIMWLQ